MAMGPAPTRKHEKNFWKMGFSLVAGVDEVGCGCWAGPVYAAAVILPEKISLTHIRDSKLLSHKQREDIFDWLIEHVSAYAMGIASVEEVDALNIRRASALASQRALDALTIKPHAVLTDAFPLKSCSLPQQAIIHGDRLSAPIAAASMIAKVLRDRAMQNLDERYPGYGFAQHKGYGTKQHQEALKKLGACEIHRRSYEPVKRVT